MKNMKVWNIKKVEWEILENEIKKKKKLAQKRNSKRKRKKETESG